MLISVYRQKVLKNFKKWDIIWRKLKFPYQVTLNWQNRASSSNFEASEIYLFSCFCSKDLLKFSSRQVLCFLAEGLSSSKKKEKTSELENESAESWRAKITKTSNLIKFVAKIARSRSKTFFEITYFRLF